MANYDLSVDSSSLEKFQALLIQAPAQTIAAMVKAIGDSANAIVTKARGYAPHQYGALQDSIHAEPPTITPGNVTQQVGTDLFYAPYQEYGTGVYGTGPGATGQPITPVNKKALFWPGAAHPVKSVQGVKPKLFMAKAFEDGKDILNTNVSNALSAILSFLANG